MREKSKWVVWYEGFEDWTSGLLLFIGLSLIMINVVLRYVWGMPESLLDEFSVYFVVWGIFIGFSVALRNNHHIRVDMLFDQFPLHVKRYCTIFAHTCGLVFTMFYTYFGTVLVMNYYRTGQGSTDSQFPLWIVNLIMPISGLMFGARFVEKLVLVLKDGGKAWIEELGRGGHA